MSFRFGVGSVNNSDPRGRLVRVSTISTAVTLFATWGQS